MKRKGTKQVTHDNHYVPQFYLKRWSRNGNTVRTYNGIVSNKGVPVWKSTPIKSTAYQPDLYTVRIDRSDNDEYESYLERKIETPAAEVFRAIDRHTLLTTQDVNTLVQFLVAQMTRTPSWYQQVAKTIEEIFEDTAKETIREIEKELSEKGIEALRQGRRAAPRSVGLTSLGDMPLKCSLEQEQSAIRVETYIGRQPFVASSVRALTGQISQVLHSYNWRIIYLDDEVSLPTSDNPVVIFGRDRFGNTSVGLDIGLGTRFADIVMPLSPQALLFTEVGRTKDEIDAINFDSNLVLYLRELIINNAYRYVYSQEDIPEIENIRPRLVDACRYKEIRDEQERWHREQCELEEAFPFSCSSAL